MLRLEVVIINKIMTDIIPIMIDIQILAVNIRDPELINTKKVI
jgi:hypothetical protein